MKKFIVATLAAAAVLVPSLAFAQTSTTGLLTVYVQVINQNQQNVAPSNLTVNVAGQSPSPAIFPGSQNGTQVSLNPGSYAVTLTGNANMWSPSYSVGCNSTMAAGQTQLCVITVSPNYNYNYSYNYPYSNYPYQNVQQTLTCTPAYQTVAAGQTVSFTAQGGFGGTYNWSTPERNYPNAGPVLSIALNSSGSQLVTVTNGPQSATCSVNVSTSGAYFPNYPTYPTYNPYGTTGYTYSYIPRLPNTGFEPIQSASIAFAVVLLLGAAIAVAPYVRKTITALS